MNRAKQTQIAKYGSEEAYKAEMKRRRSLVKKPGFAAMDPEKHKELSRKGGLSGKKTLPEDLSS